MEDRDPEKRQWSKVCPLLNFNVVGEAPDSSPATLKEFLAAKRALLAAPPDQGEGEKPARESYQGEGGAPGRA